jgi:NAD(P)H-hydrate epimerase
MNESHAVVVSIDVPSGLFADTNNDVAKDVIVQADYTLSLELPKHSFMFAENEMFVGQLEIIPIGLHPQFIHDTNPVAYILQNSSVASLIKPRLKHSHKGHFGHALLLAGSLGKMGAARLSGYAALRSGLGLLTMHIPAHGNAILQTGLPEAMLSMDDNDLYITHLPKELGAYNAIGIGPGIGKNSATEKAFKFLIQESHVPLVIDADALNILADNPTYLAFLSEGSILTPHPGEFERLVGKCTNGFERIQKQMELARKYKLYVILKGAHTSVVSPEGQLYYNPTGNSGMSTAGSGDVLTGIILGLMAQSYHSLEACILGVYLHGRAGDLALTNQSVESLIASDIVENLGAAFKSLL